MSCCPKCHICQSCAMPLCNPQDFGTEADNSITKEYCRHCYASGNFTQPDLDFDGMVKHLVKVLAEMEGVSEDDAQKRVEKFIPMLKQLKRWQ